MTISKQHWMTAAPQSVKDEHAALMRESLRKRLAERQPVDKWARLAMDLATARVDSICAIHPVDPSGGTWSPENQREWMQIVARVVYNALKDELVLPDAERSLQRLQYRWDTYQLYLHDQKCPRKTQDLMCPVCDVP